MLSVPGLKGVVLETFGAGNATTADWFLQEIHDAIQRGILILNVTQCPAGRVDPGKYETSRLLHETGVLNGRDMTSEAAVTKLMFLFSQSASPDMLNVYLNKSISGEISE
jgi:L-asparaginase